MSKKKLAGIIVGCIIAIIVIAAIVTARPTPTYRLSVSVNPPQAGSVSPSGGEYESGVQITLTATPASGYSFDYWKDPASSSSNTVSSDTVIISMNSHKGIIAYFKAVEADGSGFKKVTEDMGVNMGVGCEGPKHFYKSGRIIVVYCGDNDSTIRLLTNGLGEQLAGV